MRSTFLHDEKPLPPDEAVDPDPPECPRCHAAMWLAFVETKTFDGGACSTRKYECKLCGDTRVASTFRKWSA